MTKEEIEELQQYCEKLKRLDIINRRNYGGAEWNALTSRADAYDDVLRKIENILARTGGK